MYVLKEGKWFRKKHNYLTEDDTKDVTLTWKDLSVYAMDRGRKNVRKRLIDNGVQYFVNFRSIIEYNSFVKFCSISVRGAAEPGNLTAIIGARQDYLLKRFYINN